MKNNVGALILAGGKSERMVFPKPYLLYNGKTFIENITEGYFNADIKQIVLVIRDEFCSGKWEYSFQEIKPFVAITEKLISDKGRFYSLKKGLRHFQEAEFCFVHNVDNPFIDKATIQSLWENKNEDGYTKAIHNKEGGHPLLLSKKIIQRINNMDDGDYNLKNILNEYSCKIAEVISGEILLNINTPADYEKYIHPLKT